MNEFIGVFLTPTLLVVGGWIWKKFPPKKINHLYGYRTRRSMANQTIWDHANQLGAQMLRALGFVLLILGLFLWLFLPSKAVIISLFLMIVGIGVGMYWCETMLNRKFDGNGNLK